ncbi:MAG: acetylglucosamine-6-sulfatase [Rhodopirellula sp.]|nr:acetylglucosamine-6-sulfatase [Rhodopirellula sp.]
MKILARIALLLAIVAVSTTSLRAGNGQGTETEQAKSDAPKSVTPEVQTAAWAVKWWQPRHDQKLADLKKMEQVDLLMVGDSITQGWEGRGKNVWAEYYVPRNAFNIGFSGDRTENVLWRLQHDAVKGISPKLAVVMIGTNNTGHRQDPAEETAAGIKAIIAELQKQLPKTKILLLAIFPRGAKTDDPLRKLNAEINEIIADFADDQKVYFLDINSEFLDDDGTLPRSVMPDLLHPQEAGYATWAKAMDPTIAKLMGE